jgi:hypothetical protein
MSLVLITGKLEYYPHPLFVEYLLYRFLIDAKWHELYTATYSLLPSPRITLTAPPAPTTSECGILPDVQRVGIWSFGLVYRDSRPT